MNKKAFTAEQIIVNLRFLANPSLLGSHLRTGVQQRFERLPKTIPEMAQQNPQPMFFPQDFQDDLKFELRRVMLSCSTHFLTILICSISRLDSWVHYYAAGFITKNCMPITLSDYFALSEPPILLTGTDDSRQ